MKFLRDECMKLNSIGIKAEVWIDEETALRRCLAGLLFENSEEAKRGTEYLEERIRSLGIRIKCSRLRRLVQVILPAAGKGETLRALIDFWQISPSQTLCIGDGANDISMLDGRYGFIPATLSNAEDDVKDVVKKCGGYIASKARGRGVLEVLHVHGLI